MRGPYGPQTLCWPLMELRCAGGEQPSPRGWTSLIRSTMDESPHGAGFPDARSQRQSRPRTGCSSEPFVDAGNLSLQWHNRWPLTQPNLTTNLASATPHPPAGPPTWNPHNCFSRPMNNGKSAPGSFGDGLPVSFRLDTLTGTAPDPNTAEISPPHCKAISARP